MDSNLTLANPPAQKRYPYSLDRVEASASTGSTARGRVATVILLTLALLLPAIVVLAGFNALGLDGAASPELADERLANLNLAIGLPAGNHALSGLTFLAWLAKLLLGILLYWGLFELRKRKRTQ